MTAFKTFKLRALVFLVGAFCATSAFAYDNWTWRNPTPTGETVNGLIWDGSRYVAAANGGILTSVTGVGWTALATASVQNMHGIFYTGSLYVAVGGSGAIQTSPDAVLWTARTSGVVNTLRKVTFNGSGFVAVGDNGKILTSPDAETWTERTSGVATQLNGVAWDGTQFVVAGHSGVILTSPDGATWTPQTSGTAVNLWSITWNGSKFVATGSTGTFLTSTDGITWSVQASLGSYSIYTVIWTGTQFVSSTASSGGVLTSPDGETWTLHAFSAGSLFALATNGSAFLAAGSDGLVATSSDAITWTNHLITASTWQILNVTWGNNLFVAVNIVGNILTSPDGTVWTVRTAGSTNLNQVIWADTQFVAMGNMGSIYTSPDGFVWTSRVGGGSTYTSLTRNDTMFVALTSNAVIRTSKNAVTWTTRTSSVAGYWNNITWGSGLFVCVGNDGVIRTSPDGLTWTSRTSGTIEDLNYVLWIGDKFVVSGWNGTILTSPDGITWTSRLSGGGRRLTQITKTEGTVVVVGSSGTLLTSPDGITWTQRIISATSLGGVAHNRTRVVAVGNAGAILTTERPVPDISYASPQIYATNVAIATLNPSNTGTAATSWSISPSLHDGLSFNTSTGAITGSPSGVFPATNFIVTASNGEGYDTTTVNIEVKAAPTNLTYTQNVAVYSRDVGITINRPTVGGGAIGLSYELVSGTFPTGVSLSLVTGNIYGTPTDTGLFAPQIRVSNSVGFALVTLDLRVKDPTPIISYAPGSFLYPLGSAITTLSPVNAGGEIRSWSITPDLTANTGLSFNTSTGKIFGTPTKLSADTAYTVTAQGVGELAVHSIPLVVRITTVAPTVAYADDALDFPVNSAITPLAKTGATGLITGYSISPALPAGLQFNLTTGRISGTPTVAVAATFYTITVTGPGGTGTDSVSIATTTAAPTLDYTDTPQLLQMRVAMSLQKLSASGIIRSYSIAPSLPVGLTFNPTTGAIFGTPTDTASSTTYTITAHGPGGTGSDIINLAVDPEPLGFAYASDTLAYLVGQTISVVSPTLKVGGFTGYSVAPSLPAGLVLNPTTGRISGTPTAVAAAAAYTITAQARVGSTTASVVIRITTPAPTVSYANDSLAYLAGVTISTVSKTGATGIITGYSISPTLPAGLSFSTTTGKIYGTPTTVTTAGDYTITAHGPGGTGSDTINISVSVNAPSIAFAADSASFVRGAEITAFRPVNSGGQVLSWSISLGSNGTSLTANTGLLFNPTTGKILGTPAYLSAPVTYTVTATGLSGSQSQSSIVIKVTDPISKLGMENSEGFSFRVTGRMGSAYSLRLPAAIGTAERVIVSVSDLSGRIVWSHRVVRAEASVKELMWDGKSNNGRTVPAGMYFVHASAVVDGKSTESTGMSALVKP